MAKGKSITVAEEKLAEIIWRTEKVSDDTIPDELPLWLKDAELLDWLKSLRK